MDEQTLRKGYRNAWILTLALILLVAVWTWFTIATNSTEVPPGWSQGGRPFVPGESAYGLGYSTPTAQPQE
jgi:hypothetical protein